MSELLIARKINSLDEVVKASRIGKKKDVSQFNPTDMNDMINERDMEEAEVMMADLYEAFRQYYSQLELQTV